MIRQEKMPTALYIIHQIMSQARATLASSGDLKHVYEMMDWGELLPAIIARPGDDATEEFRESLVGLGQSCPELSGLVVSFDRCVTFGYGTPTVGAIGFEGVNGRGPTPVSPVRSGAG